MPEYQRQTVEAKRTRFWGGAAALGGLALAAIGIIGVISASAGEHQACDVPKPTEICTTARNHERAITELVEYGGGLALAGSIAFFGANEFDRRLLVLRYTQHINYEVNASETSNLEEYMRGLPTPPKDIVPPGDD